MDLNLLSAGAAKGLVESLQSRFTSETGVSIRGTFRAVGAIKEKLLAGEPCDVVILTAAQLDELARFGRVVPDSVGALGRVRTAIAVKSGEPLPDISDWEALSKSALASSAIYLPDAERATAGIHFVNELKALCIYAEVETRLHSYPNGAMAMHELALSEHARPMGCAQVTEIRYTPGVTLVGPLPPGFDLETIYSVAVNTKSHQPELARRFAGMLTGQDTSELRATCGFELQGSPEHTVTVFSIGRRGRA
jgi:molybdate transport system substrate-binding protein